MTSSLQADVVVQNIKSYYDAGHIPYKFHTIWSGESLPCLDRRAWLHLVVYKIKAGPDEAHKVRAVDPAFTIYSSRTCL